MNKCCRKLRCTRGGLRNISRLAEMLTLILHSYRHGTCNEHKYKDSYTHVCDVLWPIAVPFGRRNVVIVLCIPG